MNSTSGNAHFAEISVRNAARIAGFGLLFMVIPAMYANFSGLVVQGDAFATTNNILASEGRFRLNIASFFVVLVLDVVVAWALYITFKPVKKSLSLLAAWFRLVYAAVFGMSLLNYANVLRLLDGADVSGALGDGGLPARVMASLGAFYDGWAIGFVFFGFHLVLLGYLAFRSRFIPWALGVLVVIAGAGYLIDSFGVFLSPDYSLDVALYTGVGELLLMLWLLFRGGKIHLPQAAPEA